LVENRELLYRGSLARNFRLDFYNVILNPFALTLPMVSNTFICLILIGIRLSSEKVIENTVPITSLLLVSAFSSALINIPFEMREGYSERISLELGTHFRRLFNRAFSLFVFYLPFHVIVITILALQTWSKELSLKVGPEYLLRYFFALLLATAFGVSLGTIVKRYQIASVMGIFGFALLFATKLDASQWWSPFFYVARLFDFSAGHRTLANFTLLSQLCFFTALIAAGFLGRSFNLIKSKTVTIRNGKLSEFLGHQAERSPLRRGLAVATLQILSIPAHLRVLPFVVFIMIINPLFANRAILESISPKDAIGLSVSLIAASILLAAIATGNFKFIKEHREQEALFHRDRRRYEKLSTVIFVVLITAIALATYFVGVVLYSFINADELTSLIIARGGIVLLMVVPVYAGIGRYLVSLEIPVAFYLLIDVIPLILESIISGAIPSSVPYLPSSLIASLAGGRSLYQLIATFTTGN
jgi:hypothetical protein